MTKEELEKEAEVCMHNALFWLKLPISKENVEQGGSYILKLLEPREKRIAELEAEVKEWKDKADLWCKTANLKDHNIMINKELEEENAELKEELTKKADTNHSLVEQMADLESEIVELKEKYAKNITDCDICDTYCNSQLTKAKEIIKELVRVEYADFTNGDYSNELSKVLEQAERFISEVEK